MLKVHGVLASKHGEIVADWAPVTHGIVPSSEWDIADFRRNGRSW